MEEEMNSLWTYIEDKTEKEKFLESKFEDMPYQYKNCFVFSFSKYLIASKNPIAKAKSPCELMDYIRQEYTENPIELKDKYIIDIKNIENLNADADNVLIIKNNQITELEKEYINNFSYCLIFIEYETGPHHFEFWQKNDEINVIAKKIVLHLKK